MADAASGVRSNRTNRLKRLTRVDSAPPQTGHVSSDRIGPGGHGVSPDASYVRTSSSADGRAALAGGGTDAPLDAPLDAPPVPTPRRSARTPLLILDNVLWRRDDILSAGRLIRGAPRYRGADSCSCAS